jgi:hypothetical protein
MDEQIAKGGAKEQAQWDPWVARGGSFRSENGYWARWNGEEEGARR